MGDQHTTKQCGTAWSTVLWRYTEHSQLAFDPSFFDTTALRKQGLIEGSASAGRGNTVFFSANSQPLVLRHYYRGGLVQRLSRQHYLFTGMCRTRALREFDMLAYLHSCNLPAPRPYACRVLRRGLFYQASLITHRLPGSTLSERLLARAGSMAHLTISDDGWRAVGRAIARFHKAGVYHADLNAHNVMVENDEHVMLIDFDRSRLRPLPSQPASAGWCLDNLQRLDRSLAKLARLDQSGKLKPEKLKHGFALCKDQWENDISQLAE